MTASKECERGNVMNCEEYVVDKLMNLETKVASLESERDANKRSFYALSDLLHAIMRLASIQTTGSGERYINFQSVWESYDKDTFDYLAKALSGTEGDA